MGVVFAVSSTTHDCPIAINHHHSHQSTSQHVCLTLSAVKLRRFVQHFKQFVHVRAALNRPTLSPLHRDGIKVQAKT